MAYSEAQKKATEKWNKEAYDEIKLRVEKGNKKTIQDYAKMKKTTVNSLINELLAEEISKEIPSYTFNKKRECRSKIDTNEA